MRRLFSIISSQVRSRKKVVFCGLVVILLFSFVPLHFAQAGLPNAIAGAILNIVTFIPNAIIGVLAEVIKLIAELLASGMEANIKLLIDIPVSPNNPGTPLAIREGWATVRNLVNIVFILILTLIGLATILRIQSYQLQKTLPSLVIMAILINFSGVLVGFVVDIGSVVTRAILNLDPVVGAWDIGGDLSKLGIGGVAGLGTSLVSIVYYVLSLLIYFVVILLFGIRTLVLWTLTILSPIAFAAYILPGTKKYWTQWLQQLIQWSILGIPISLTLYLAKQVINPEQF